MKNIYNIQPWETSPPTGHQYKELYCPLRDVVHIIYCCENTFIDFCQLKKTGYKKVYREESNFGKSDVYGNENGRI